jgi:glycosyltransferase involved in cell wall biosynthesis
MFSISNKLWNIIDNLYDDDTIIWVVSEGSLKHLGKQLLDKKYILHLLELNEEIYYISGNPILKLDYKRLAKTAKVVVEAEYNRAHITKAWWELEILPSVFPNKPYNTIEIERNAPITSSEDIRTLMDNLCNKKIILYQGNISKERPLQEYIKAVGELGNEYAFLMMINGENPYPELKYENFYFIPFIKPPFHLEVTSRAYIGILSYTPIKNDYSILNTLYCAPNKIWEYAKFGIPMIGNDLPALQEMFLRYQNGICLRNLTKETIKETIQKINENYQAYEKESLQFFNSVDLREIVKSILEKC